MKSKALRLFAAAAIGASLLAPGPVRPAWADGCPDYEICAPSKGPNWQQYYDLVVDFLAGLMSKAKDGLDPVEIAEMLLELKDKLLGVKTDLFERVNALAAADIQADLKFTVDNPKMLDRPQTQGYYVGRVASAAANSYEKLTVFSSDAARDTIARAMMTEYDALITGEIKVGYDPSYGPQRQALQHIIENVKPQCNESIDPKLGWVSYICTFNGNTLIGTQRMGLDGAWERTYDGSHWLRGTVDYNLVATTIMTGTAQDLAKQALEKLNQGGH